MTDQEFDLTWEDAERKLEQYIANQKTDKQKANAKHHLHSMQINKNYYRHNKDKAYQCCKCGAVCNSNYSEPHGSRMRGNQTCFHCDFWEERANEVDLKRLVIDGHTYGDAGNRPASDRFLGFAGHRFYIRQGDRIWTTNNLWSGGVIPEEFRDRMPDNAEFLTEAQYKELTNENRNT